MSTALNPAEMYLLGLSEGSRRTMRESLAIAAELLGHKEGGDDPNVAHPPMDWQHLKPEEAPKLRDALQGKYSPATANKILAAVRGVLRECVRTGAIEPQDAARLEFKSIRGERQPRGRAVSNSELRALFATCAAMNNASGKRDAALLAVLYAGGLRRAEAAALTVADCNPPEGSLRVLGKGNKQRMVYLAHGARRALSAWLEARGDAPGALFCAVDKRWGKRVDTRRPMTEQTIYDALRRRAKAAGIERFSPHDLRRTFIGDLLDAGADIATVQRLAGHASVTTTARYDRRPEEAKRKAAELLDVPFVA